MLNLVVLFLVAMDGACGPIVDGSAIPLRSFDEIVHGAEDLDGKSVLVFSGVMVENGMIYSSAHETYYQGRPIMEPGICLRPIKTLSGSEDPRGIAILRSFDGTGAAIHGIYKEAASPQCRYGTVFVSSLACSLE